MSMSTCNHQAIDISRHEQDFDEYTSAFLKILSQTKFQQITGFFPKIDTYDPLHLLKPLQLYQVDLLLYPSLSVVLYVVFNQLNLLPAGKRIGKYSRPLLQLLVKNT